MKIKIFFAASAIFFMFSFSFSAENPDFKKGAAAYIAGNSDEAMILLYKAYTTNPGDKKTKALLAEVYLDQAETAMAGGDYVAASKYINEAAKLKVMEGKVIKIKESLRALSAKEKPKIEKPSKKTRGLKKKKQTKKDKKEAYAAKTKKVMRQSARKKTPPQSVSPIIIKERVIERPAKAMSWQKQAAIAAAVLGTVIVTAFIFLKLYLSGRAKEANLLEEKQIAEKRLQKEIETLKESSAKLKTDIDAEKKKKKAETPVNYISPQSSEKENKELKKRLEKLEESLNAVRTASAKPKPSRELKFSEERISFPAKYFLPTYTEVPLKTSSLSEMLEKASGLSERLKLLWALGNKAEISAVETLESHLSKAKGEEYREILKSLKKISLRPEISTDIKAKVEGIFSVQRRSGIII